MTPEGEIAMGGPETQPVESNSGDALSPAGAELLSPEMKQILTRGPGRPRGVPNKVNIATRERLAAMVDPIAFQALALRRGWVRVAGERVYLDADQLITLAQGLGRKVLPDLRATEVSGLGGQPLVAPNFTIIMASS